MENEKKIILYKTDEEIAALQKQAEILVKNDQKYLYYRILCAFISLIFLAYAVYSTVFLIQSAVSFRFAMLIYIIVPLIGAALPFSFVKLKFKELCAQICEEKGTAVMFTSDRITVEGSKKRKLVRKSSGKAVFESRASVFSDSDGKPIPFRYDIRINELRYYAYGTEESKLRFILGTEEYPDIILTENEALKEIFAELESRGIKKTAFIK